jgi:hypothetical protein
LLLSDGCAQVPVVSPSLIQSGPPPLVEEEQDVNLILARNVHFNNMCIGMPAFSSSSAEGNRPPEIRVSHFGDVIVRNSLIFNILQGFYIQSEQEICKIFSCSGQQSFTQLFFKPASKVPAMKREELSRHIHAMLQVEVLPTESNISAYSSAVFELDKHGFDLQVMRERALCSCLLFDLEPLLATTTSATSIASTNSSGGKKTSE